MWAKAPVKSLHREGGDAGFETTHGVKTVDRG
jgi:hypothetical protein